MVFWGKKFSPWITRMRHQTVLPLRVILWNGLQFDLAEVTPSDGTPARTFFTNVSAQSIAGKFSGCVC